MSDGHEGTRKLRSEIRGIRTLWKYGAHGDPSKQGYYIYGTRPDGKTVPCHHEIHPDGSVEVWSTWRSPSCNPGEVAKCASEFSASEWRELSEGVDGLEPMRCEQILNRRK